MTWRKPSSWVDQFSSLSPEPTPLFWVDIFFWVNIHHYFHSSGFLSFTSLPSSGSLWIYLIEWLHRSRTTKLFLKRIWKSILLHYCHSQSAILFLSLWFFPHFHWCITIMLFLRCSTAQLTNLFETVMPKYIYTSKFKKENPRHFAIQNLKGIKLAFSLIWKKMYIPSQIIWWTGYQMYVNLMRLKTESINFKAVTNYSEKTAACSS